MTGERFSSVVFLNRFYAPEVAATAQMLSDLAEDLVEDGWRVTVITGRTSYEGTNQTLAAREVLRGVEVWRVSGTRFGRRNIAGRIFDYLSYFALSFAALFRVPQPDIIIAMSDPPFVLLGAVIAARMRRARVVYWAQDVYPALAAKLGVLDERKPGYKFLRSLASHLLGACDQVIGLGPAMVRSLVEQGSPPGRTSVIHNWADEESIRPVAKSDNWFLAEHALQEKFVVLYSGNAGRGHTFTALCEVMLRFRHDEDVIFLFIGGGKRSPVLQSFARAHQLSNARFMEYVSRDDLAYSLSSASVSLVTEDPAVSGLLLPSKTYGILASGRPIIFVGSAESDVAEIVRNNGCGIVVTPDDPDSLEGAIRELMADPTRLTQMGCAARLASETKFSRHSATERWSVQLQTLLRAGLSRTSTRA